MKKRPLSPNLVATLSLLAASFFPAGAAEPSSGTDGGFFDLFGRKIEPQTQNIDGAMPEGELKIVINPSKPRFFSRKRNRASKPVAQPRIPINARRITWGRKDELYVNTTTSNQATHIVRSGDRVVLKNFD